MPTPLEYMQFARDGVMHETGSGLALTHLKS